MDLETLKWTLLCFLQSKAGETVKQFAKINLEVNFKGSYINCVRMSVWGNESVSFHLNRQGEGHGTREDFQTSPLEKFENSHVYITK